MPIDLVTQQLLKERQIAEAETVKQVQARDAAAKAELTRIAAEREAQRINAAVETFRQQVRRAWIGTPESFEKAFPDMLREWQQANAMDAQRQLLENKRNSGGYSL